MGRMRKYVVLISLLFIWASLGAGATFSMELEEGWNMVSSPVTGVGEGDLNDNCDRLSGPWTWNPGKGEYERADSLGVGKAYWVKVGSACSFQVDGTPPDSLFLNLGDGWNMVATTDTTLPQSNIAAMCDRRSGPWGWDASERIYNRVDRMNPTEGYWVKVSGDCQVSDKNVEAEADWDFLVAEEDDEKLTGWFEVGNMDLTSVEGIDRIDRYRIDLDFKDDGDFDRTDAGLIKRVSKDPDLFDPTFQDMGETESSTTDRMLIPLDYSDIQPWREPVNIRLTVVEPMLIKFPDRDVYRFIEAGDNRSFPAGDRNAGCREESGALVCRDMGLTTDAEFSCDDEEHSVGVTDVEVDNDRTKFFYRPTTTWKTIDSGGSSVFSDSDGNPVFSVSVQDTGTERDWKVTDFTVACE